MASRPTCYARPVCGISEGRQLRLLGRLETLSDSRPIGLFDSGLGGLAVLKEVQRQWPTENILFFADQGRLPYGPRPTSEIRFFAEQITNFLLAHQAKVIVVACNTASAAALAHLRQTFPNVPFVGMEPAVKPAAEQTQSKVVGVIATQSTCQSEVFSSVVERFAKDVKVLPQACPGLVTQVEAGEFDSSKTNALLHEYLDPMLAAGIDSLVLACTHYTFLTTAIQQVVGPNVRIIDPAPAVAKQAGRVIEFNDSPKILSVQAFTTGTDPSALATQLLGQSLSFQAVNLEKL
jgi:glutamate racemase